MTKVFAAGSLRASLTEVADSFRAQGGGEVDFEFGPSGLLRERLARRQPCDVFASANMEHPYALVSAGIAGPVALFARNQMCALAHARGGITTANLLDRMLDPAVKLGTSTPNVDPAGDYAWQVFARAAAVRPGAYETLSEKALPLVGGPETPMPRPWHSPYGTLVASGRADIFLTYCTNATFAAHENPSLVTIALPEWLAVGADYGMVVMNGACDDGRDFARFILAPRGQRILEAHGFAAPRPTPAIMAR